ncbi:MAG: RNA polymerase sigma factor [Phycisphaerales bacterium JB050]
MAGFDQTRPPPDRGQESETARIDHADLRELWLAHRRWVGAILLAHKPAREDLEDLLHEVALRFVRSAGELRDPASVRPWLRTVAVNVARTAGRKTRVRHDAARTVAEQVSDRAYRSDLGGAPASERLSAREEAERAMAAARRLPEHYREPLLLRAVRGMSYRQIADTLGVPMTTVETRLARARRMLREELESPTDPSAVAGEES